MRTPKPSEYLTIPQAAQAFGYCSLSTLRKAAQDGKLRHVRVGERVILTTEDWVLDWEAEHDGRGRPRGLRRSS
jgi:excisionase family DNA binding protein